MKKLFPLLALFFSLCMGAQELVSDIGPNGRYGFKNAQGTFVIAPQYDGVHFGFYRGVACVVKNKSYFLINEKGEMVSSKYSWVGMFDERGLCKVAKKSRPDDDGNPLGGVYGFVDLSGREAIPAKYAVFEDFGENGVAIVNKGGKLDKKTGTFGGGKYGFIGRDGAIILKPKYTKIGKFDASGKAWANIGGTVDDLGNCKGGKYGVVDNSGREIAKVKYESVGEFHDGIAIVKKDLYGYIDENGREITKLKYNVATEPVNGLAKVGALGYAAFSENRRVLYGFINTSGTPVTGLVYNEAGDFTDGFAYVKKGDKIGFINPEGKPLTEMIYDEFNSKAYGLAICSKGGSLGCVNGAGVETVPFIYSALFPVSGKAIAAQVGRSDKGEVPVFRLIDFHGTALTPNYIWMGLSPDVPLVSVKQQGVGAGAVDFDGKVVIPLIYEDIYPFRGGVAPVKLGGKWGYVNAGGKLFADCKYESVSVHFKEGVGAVCLGGKWGGVSTSGDIVIPLQLKSIEELFEIVNSSYVKYGRRPLTDRDVKAFKVRKVTRSLRFSITNTIEDSYWDY